MTEYGFDTQNLFKLGKYNQLCTFFEKNGKNQFETSLSVSSAEINFVREVATTETEVSDQIIKLILLGKSLLMKLKFLVGLSN